MSAHHNRPLPHHKKQLQIFDVILTLNWYQYSQKIYKNLAERTIRFMAISVSVSVGEAMDKLTILHIKSERIDDAQKLKNIHNEIAALTPVCSQPEFNSPEVKALISELKAVNEALWDIEDKIRDKEAIKAFDDEFISLARSVYITNDKRAELKKQINLATGSALVEEKSYQDYS